MDTKEFLGQLVHVVVDRPIGYLHKGMVYPINYGYIPGVIFSKDEIREAVHFQEQYFDSLIITPSL